MFAGNFAPSGWMFCDGQLLPISEYETLFNLIGTTYGGDGQSTFGLPDLRSRVPIHQGSNGSSNYVLAQIGGTETVTLTVQQIPQHSHVPVGRGAGSESPNPANMYWGESDVAQYAAANSTGATMNANAVGTAGQSQPHDNMLPFVCVSFIISLFGIFPSQT